jgi:hypothetical protein
MALTKVSPDLLDLDAGITITTTDNSDNLTLTSTDADANAGPNLRMYRNSGSPADNDYIGEIQFEGRNDNSQDVIYAGLAARILDASDGTEDGRFELFTIRNGSQISTMVTTATETVFNEDSIDHDFRVESDGNANMLIVDADTNRVGIGVGSPSNNLEIFTDAGDEGLTIKATGNTSNAIISDANRSSAGNAINQLIGKWNGTAVCDIQYLAGSDTTNKDNGQIKFFTASAGTTTERMVIDDEGNVGIGISGPSSILHVKNSAADGVAGISLENDARRYAINVHGGLSDGLAIYNAGAGETQFFISSAGNVGIGADNTSPDSILSIKDASSDPILTVHKNATGANDAMRVQHGRGLSGFTGKGITFRRNDGTEVGNVTIGFSSTAFNTSSDYRLKENITYTWDATTRLKQLKPARFTFKDDTSNLVDGFLAHEVSSIVPEAINGEKDAVDSEGNPEYQSIDQSKLVPLLVKTIQELEARITALES